MDEALTQAERDDVALLTGPGAREILQAALAAEGAALGRWEVHTVHHRPGAGVTVGYTVSARGQDDYLCATTGRVTAPAGDGLVRLESGGSVVHVWRHPADPELPALGDACSPAGLAGRLGVARPPAVELLAYRPLRRAVVRARGEALADGQVYAKVVRPRTLRDLATRHRLLTEAGVPAPEVLLAAEDGLLVIRSGRGASLASELARGMGTARARATLENVVAVLDRLPAAVLDLPRRAAWAERADHYGHAASVVLPEHRARIERLAAGVGAALGRTDPGPVVPTHGDLYEANLLMAADRVSAVLDVDSVGPGHRVDDLACLLAHVSVLPHLAPRTYPQVPAVLATWTEMCSRWVDPGALRARAAGVVLSLVAGARRREAPDWRVDAEGRLAEAERWLAGA
ncbi:aminoglycoside phosphotransferase family protein [Georgenia wutianyii]|uniref:Aminoglycoside phosphotransferase family protein n=1 Tax=Georgenia wutianyii TaxID=2585135 RepID=A0ABX5VR20_9MICO|nr:phosphotransferase [Georgenia wutianyii]QDB80271.1 aminoglycoside phosphotransferase family protein [Georgenia wutianyii]